ncbi:MAG TPA: lipopolysaccharide biosynthesis protein [Burkholderiaceae bacterium]|jgi:O-antigen/teichoic acid export membrane protein
MDDIGARGVSAAKWGVISTVGRFALQLIAQIVIARLLGPDIYGVFAMGLVVLTFSNFVADFGFAWSLVQKPELREAHIRFAFTWQMIAGVLAAVVLYFGASGIAGYFHDPRVQPIIEWLSLACVMNAAAAPPLSLLQRDMDFRRQGLIQLWGYGVGYLVIGIPLALLGAGVWTLVTAWLTQSFVIMVLAHRSRRLPNYRPLLWHVEATDILKTSSTVFATNLCNWLLNNMDRMIIGRLLSAAFLGLYTVGYNLATLPNSLLLSALQPAFLSAGARMNGDTGRLRKAYVEVLAAIVVMVTPAFALMACAAPYLIRVLYGVRWAQTGEILAILFTAMPAFIIWGMSTPVLWNTRRAHLETLLQLPIMAIAAAAYFLLAGQGVVSAAGVTAGVLALRGLTIAVAAFRALELRFAVVAPQFLRGGLLSLLAAAGTLGAAAGVASLQLPLATLITALAGGIVLPVAAVLLWPSLLGLEAATMVGRFVPASVAQRFGRTRLMTFVMAATA